MKKLVEQKIPLPVRQVLNDFGRLIELGRKEKRMTQQELADRIGIGRMTVVRMEKGAHEVAISNYLTAAWVLSLQVLAWTDFVGLRSDSATADYLDKIGQHLPKRIRKTRERIDNDF